MAFFVKIRRDTIRKNPNAGRTEHVIPGPASITISGKFFVYDDCDSERKEKIFGVLEEFFSGRDALLNYAKIEPVPGGRGEVGSFEGAGLRMLTAEECEAFGSDLGGKLKDINCSMPVGNFDVNMHREVQRVWTLTPEPPYLFRYEDKLVRCSECEKEFMHDAFDADSISDGDGGEIWSNRICPECGYWNCCEVEYERISKEMIDACEVASAG